MIRMKIKDICDLQNGRAFKPSDWGTAGVPIIRIQNLNDERAPFNYYSGKYNLAQEVDNGDLLFSWSGTPGTSFGAFLWNRGKGVLNQHIFKVIPKVEVDKTYLMYALNGNISTIISKAHGGVGLQHITKKELDEIEIQMVSISRQKKIVEILEKISLLIFLRKQQLEKLDELVKARFVEKSKEWQAVPGQLNEFLEDITYGFTNPMPDAEEGPWKVTAKDVVNGHINILTARKTTNEAFERLTNKSKPRKGDVLLTKDGTLGRVAVVDVENLCVNQSVAVMRCNNKIYPEFLAMILQIPEYQRKLLEDSGGGTIKHLYITKVDKMLISVPDLVIQKDLLMFAKRVEQQKQTIQQSLEKLELMKKARMQEYFG